MVTHGRLALCLVLILIGSPSSTFSQNIAITNPDFETNVIPDGTFIVFPGGPTGWSVYDPLGIINNGANSVGLIMPVGTTYFPEGATEGRNGALVYLAGANSGEAGLQQTLSATLEANTRYTMTVDVGN